MPELFGNFEYLRAVDATPLNIDIGENNLTMSNILFENK